MVIPKIYTYLCLRRVVPRNVGDPGKLSLDSGPTSLAEDLAVISGNLIVPIDEVEMVPGCFK